VTLPRSDAPSARALLRRTHFQPLNNDPPPYSLPASPAHLPLTPQVTLPAALHSAERPVEEGVQERALDFASHSWDLATGGLKTLTAKRELPALPERRSLDNLQESAGVARNYLFVLITVVCVLTMLASGGIVLFLMLQP
jgi:hypothetical protein